jgi:diguanylate cyclase
VEALVFRKAPAKNLDPFENRIIFRDWSHLRNFDEWARLLDDPALAALVSLLEIYGRYAFDIEEVKAADVRRSCADWIGHVIGGKPSPEAGSEDGDVSWEGLEKYFRGQRGRERHYVSRTLNEFRGLIWDFVRELSSSVAEDRGAHGEIRDRLRSLEESVRTQPLSEVRNHVMGAVRHIGRIMEERELRQVKQMHQLGAKLREMRAELVSVRTQMAMDPLTEVFNRASLDAQMEKVVQLNQFSGTGACLFIVDTDNFKSVNDRLGHKAGDAALKMLAGCCVRSFPRESDFIARYGGDEFVVMVEETGTDIARLMGKRLLDMIASIPTQSKDERVFVTASLGIALLEPTDTATTWFERADRALREAKSLGKNHLVLAPRSDEDLTADPTPEIYEPHTAKAGSAS